MEEGAKIPRSAWLAVAVAALGYFVDIYDLILFSMVQDPSLTGIGVPSAQQLDTGIFLQNMQMIGMLIGGLLWGILGDKRGRLSVLFGSILLYSLANIANGFVEDTSTYAVLRVVAGIGLAGELGAGITLVSELLPAKVRGYATAVVAGVGICGAFLAFAVSKTVDWRTAYFIGGGMGLALLALRLGVLESGMFSRIKTEQVSRGNFFMLFSNGRRALRYVAVVGVGLPIWYAIGILVRNSPEIAASLGVAPPPVRSTAILVAYIGLAIGDFSSGAISQLVKSRRKTLLLFLAITLVGIVFYFLGAVSSFWVYAAILVLGLGTGYWAVFVTVGAEQFGTNLRATAATTAPNFVRGGLTLWAISFQFLDDYVGLAWSAVIVGAVVMAIAVASLFALEETFGKDLDYVDT